MRPSTVCVRRWVTRRPSRIHRDAAAAGLPVHRPARGRACVSAHRNICRAPDLTTVRGATHRRPAPRTGSSAELLGGIRGAAGGWRCCFHERAGPVLRPGQLKPFTALPGEERAPAFAPDGSRIVFAWNGDADSGGGFDLYVKALDSEQLLRLTHAPAHWLSPAWSPDGTSIAFMRRSNCGCLGLCSSLSLRHGRCRAALAGAAFASDAFMQTGVVAGRQDASRTRPSTQRRACHPPRSTSRHSRSSRSRLPTGLLERGTAGLFGRRPSAGLCVHDQRRRVNVALRRGLASRKPAQISTFSENRRD